MIPLVVSLVFGAPVADAPVRTVEKIDSYWAAQWREAKVEPAPRCSDSVFVRRLYLDLLGRIPTPSERDAFEQAEAPDKRRRLVRHLLGHADYPRYWSRLWTDWLLPLTTPDDERARFRSWMNGQLTENMPPTRWVSDLFTATGTPAKNPEVVFVGNHLGGLLPKKRWESEGRFDMIPLTQSSLDLFLGIDLGCTQCHDDPFDERWRQIHFWQITTFFRQIERVPHKTDGYELRDNPEYNRTGLLQFEKRNGVQLMASPRFLGGPRFRDNPKQSRRVFFADQLTNHPDFGRAYVARLWGYFLGRPLDSSVHDEFADQVGKAFLRSGHDTKQLIYWICTSRAYGLSGRHPKAKRADDRKALFAQRVGKLIDVHQLTDSILSVVGVPFDSKEADQLRRAWKKTLLDERIEMTCEVHRTRKTLSRQRLSAWMLGSESLRNAMIRKGGLLSSVKAKPTRDAVSILYRSALGREPSKEEWQSLVRILAPQKGQPWDREAGLEDLLWALLACREFCEVN